MCMIYVWIKHEVSIRAVATCCQVLFWIVCSWFRGKRKPLQTVILELCWYLGIKRLKGRCPLRKGMVPKIKCDCDCVWNCCGELLCCYREYWDTRKLSWTQCWSDTTSTRRSVMTCKRSCCGMYPCFAIVWISGLEFVLVGRARAAALASAHRQQSGIRKLCV